MDEKTTLRQWIRWKEDASGVEYSQKALSIDSGISESYISRVLSGNVNVGKKVLTQIAATFSVSLAEFLAGPPPNEHVPAKSPPQSPAQPKSPKTRAEMIGAIGRMFPDMESDTLELLFRHAEMLMHWQEEKAQNNSPEGKSERRLDATG